MLKGTMFVTNDINVIYNSALDRNLKVVSLDEDGVLREDKNIIGGMCLLPPMEAKIAEADGNEPLYDKIYSSHLLMPFQQQFISALVAFLYKGGNLILFLPEIGYTNTTTKLIDHLFIGYGLHPGLIGSTDSRLANWFFDMKCVPIWLNLIFMAGTISAEEYLFQYPLNAPISNEQVMMMLIDSIKPYGKSINDKINYILRYHKLIHTNPNVVPAICNDD